MQSRPRIDGKLTEHARSGSDGVQSISPRSVHDFRLAWRRYVNSCLIGWNSGKVPCGFNTVVLSKWPDNMATATDPPQEAGRAFSVLECLCFSQSGFRTSSGVQVNEAAPPCSLGGVVDRQHPRAAQGRFDFSPGCKLIRAAGPIDA